MIGSPDVVAFTKDEDFGEELEDPCVLPDEFTVPLFEHAGNSNPWSKTSYAKFARDFILISEFSEQVGPQPLLTIPDESKVCGTFDLNYFSLRIMSVDYQASFVGHPPGSNYPKLNFVEDSKVVLGDSKEGAFAYVHHLTLYDLEARGFVRPFCMAYISADERKIMQQFQELSVEFSKASECLKTGNRKAFASELIKKLKDLEYTRAVLHQETEVQIKSSGCYSTQAIDKANELANVEKSIYEHMDLLRQITSYPNRKGADTQEFDKPANSPTGADQKVTPAECCPEIAPEAMSDRPKPAYTPQLIKGKSAKCFDKKLKTLEELCDSYFFHQTMEQLRLIEGTFRGDLCYIYTNRISRALLKKQRITNFLYEDCREWEDDVASKLSLPESLPPHNLLLLEAPPSPEVLLMDAEADTSEEKPPQVELSESSPSDLTQEYSEEATDAEAKVSSRTSGDSVGSTATERQEKGSTPVDPEELCPADVEGNAAGAGIVGENIGEPESTTELSTPEHHEESHKCAIYKPEPSVNGDGDMVTTQELESNDLIQALDLNNHSSLDVSAVVSADASCCMGQERFHYEEPSPEMAEEGFTADEVVKQEPQSCLQGDLAVGKAAISEASAAVLSPNDHNSDSLSDETIRMTLDDLSDTTSFLSTSTNSDRLAALGQFSSPVTVKRKKRAGQNALRFIRQYPFSQQAIFCILTGRTLVVLGSDERTVRKLVNALSIFVPNLGKYGETIQPWLCSPFQLTDLQKWKLIGLHRMSSPTGSSMLHSLNRYTRYIGVLDADQKTLRCPPYRGSLIGCMANHRTQIKRGSTYYMHVECLLTQLYSKAFLYTFCHHLHLPISLSEDQESVASRRSGFLEQQLYYSKEDGKVVQFLSELIKQAYLHESGRLVSAPVFCFSYVASISHKI
ncbi:hypothetical protein GJAV_G00225670 [Gymnothorax javanicus]|nr:hypothetical protein GJAV_G00225670 [Gymnothorax javanicus]